MIDKLDFGEALSWMKGGEKVIGPNGRMYAIENGQLVCYPKPVERPKQRRIEVKLSSESILYNDWKLYETESK